LPSTKDAAQPKTEQAEDLPTIADWFDSASALAVVVRKALDQRGSVTRGEVRKALEKFEDIDRRTVAH
jgi:hypothetical protein